MPQIQVPRRHHYIPEFYLRRWTSGKGTLVQFSKPRPGRNEVKALRVYPKQTGFVDRLYELHGVEPEVAHKYETEFFKPVDTKAANVLAKFEAGQFEVSDEERSAWTHFVLALVLRHPEQVAAFGRYMTDAVERDPSLARRGRFKLPDGRTADLARIQDELASGEGISRVAMVTLARTIANRPAGEAFINKQWGLIRTPVGAPALLTSDRPILWEQAMDHPDFCLLMPVGPKRIFFAANWRTMMAARLTGNRTAPFVNLLNDHVVRRAVRFVYGLGEHALPFVQERMGMNPRHTIIDTLFEIPPHKGRRRE